MGKRDKEIPYEVVIQERKRVDLYGNVVYYIYWFDKYGYNIMGLKERSREEAFNIIQEWTKEFTEKYGNYYFDGSYYDEIDAFIEEKLRTI